VQDDLGRPRGFAGKRGKAETTPQQLSGERGKRTIKNETFVNPGSDKKGEPHKPRDVTTTPCEKKGGLLQILLGCTEA